MIFLSKFEKRRLAKKIVECFNKVGFNKVGLNKQTFLINEKLLKDVNGDTSFYSAKSIDLVIKNLNKIIEELRK